MLATRYPGGLAEGVFELSGAADVIDSFSEDVPQGLGTFFITGGAADAITLPAPEAGSPQSGNAKGDDGRIVRFVATTAYAHTITTPANKINGTFKTITFTAAIGNFVELIAYGGVWYILAQLNATLS